MLFIKVLEIRPYEKRAYTSVDDIGNIDPQKKLPKKKKNNKLKNKCFDREISPPTSFIEFNYNLFPCALLYIFLKVKKINLNSFGHESITVLEIYI